MERTRHQSFLDEVARIPGAEKIGECIQCGTCSGACPTGARWEYPPRKVIAMVRSGMRDEVLSSGSMWYCVSCYLCSVRCPRDIKPADIMHAIETIAVQEGYKPPSRTPVMYQSFVDSIKSDGRINEMKFMMKYFLKTNPFAAFKMIPVGLSMFTHGRFTLMPKKVKGRKEVQTILKKAKEMGGAK